MTDLATGLRLVHERVTFTERGHRYAVDGEALESVTTILGDTLAKGQGFLGWIAKVTREGKDWRKVGREEADKGKAVHRTIENWARGKLGLDLLPAVEASPEAAYLASGLPAMLDAENIIPLFQPEIRLFHPQLRYCGTLDLAALWREVPTVFDVKTCPAADSYYDDWALQSAAYRTALTAHGLGDWQGAILRVPKDGGKPNILMLGDGPSDFAAFEALLRVYRWKHKLDRKSKVIQAAEKFMEARS